MLPTLFPLVSPAYRFIGDEQTQKHQGLKLDLQRDSNQIPD